MSAAMIPGFTPRTRSILGPTGIGTFGQVLTSDGAGGTSWSTVSSGVTDHGALTGLGDDDHSIYALLAGRAGGQTLTGGTASGNTLTLQSTSHATKGQVVVPAGDKLRLGSFSGGVGAPLEIQVDAAGSGFTISASSTEYTRFVSGGVSKGLLGVGAVPMVVSNAGPVKLLGGNRETVHCAASGSTAQVGFLGAAPVSRPTVSGSHGSNAALQSLLTALANLGLITNSATA